MDNRRKRAGVMININLNGKSIEVADDITVQQLMDCKNITEAAVWINDIQVLSKEYDKMGFNDNDNVKVIRMIAGG